MARDQAYYQAEKKIEEALKSGATELDLSNWENKEKLTELPESIGQLTQLQSLYLFENQLLTLPDSLGQLTQLQSLILTGNRLTTLPELLGRLTQLQSLILIRNQLTTLPESLGQLTQLPSLDLSMNQLTSLPKSIGHLTQLKSLILIRNQLTVIPESLGQLNQLELLDLSDNQLTTLPESLELLTKLKSLSLARNRLTKLPEWIGRLTQLQLLDLSSNHLTTLPESLGQLAQLQSLDISKNQLKTLPKSIENLINLRILFLIESGWNTLPKRICSLQKLEILVLGSGSFSSEHGTTFINNNNGVLKELPKEISDLKLLKALLLGGNQLKDIPSILTQLEHLKEINLDNNPLNPELTAAYKEGLDSVKLYLRLKIGPQIILNEAKLILIGEGEVGKSCLLDSLLDKPFQHHDSTHGIDIQSFNVTTDTQTPITLNAWDFGGQRVYRPTHQLFFSAPAVYLVVWKPREGSQAGQVKEWIQLVKRREPSAKILVVATHGGPQQRQPDIDRQELWDLFGKETVVDFFFVESKPDAHGNRKGIDELKRAIAQVAASLPEVGRSVPKSFADVRQALQDTGAPYLPLREVLDICRAHNMDDEIARLFITISHRLGHLTHYENDPTLRDIVILRPDWLATAMSFVLDDEETRAKHGLVNFSRLSHLWDDPNRAADSRYEKNLHPIFLRLMKRFDLSYRVADPAADRTGGSETRPDSTSLIGQLVPDIRPQNLSDAWKTSPASGDLQQTQICHIVDAGNGQSASAEGLFYQLIVRLHKYSLGRADYKDSIHWQRGLVLEDEYKSRAFLEHVGNDVRITVRSPYPEGLLGMLTREVKFLVESFWEGLRCDVMVPCINPCGKNTPGTGMFEVEKLMDSKRKNRHEFPCPVCTEWQNIDSLLRNAPAATQAISLADLQSEFASLKSELRDDMNINTRRILSQVDKTYTDLLQVLTDEAKEGPRLFSFFPVDRSAFNPKTWIREKFRLVLWCEHSRLPLPVLNHGDMKKGVYDLELDREWFKKSAPYLKFLTGTLGMVLPVASSAVKFALDETAYKLIEEQLDFGTSIIDAAIGETTKIGDFLGAADSTSLEHGIATRADGSALRELHALLKAKDPGFGGLVRVMNKRQEFLWVHEKFAGEY
ncbi:MAG: COR domain-containing protein [Chloroflexota bacterium]